MRTFILITIFLVGTAWVYGMIKQERADKYDNMQKNFDNKQILIDNR